MHKTLNERALRPLILRDLIHDIISVDEYTPKIDENNIVVMFQVKDNFDAAYDLSSFIERSPEEIVDTEASETPNIDGMYNVFVEFERNAEFPSKLANLIKDIENICPNPGWKLQVYGVNDPIDIDIKKIMKTIRLHNEEELKEFFNYAPVQIKSINEGIFIKSIYGTELTYEKSSGFISESKLKELLNAGTTLDNTRLSSVLGESYDVLQSGREYIVGINGKYVVLR